MGHWLALTLNPLVPLKTGEGLFVYAPRPQNQPGAQSPVGSGSPAPSQYLPPEEHSDMTSVLDNNIWSLRDNAYQMSHTSEFFRKHFMPDLDRVKS